MSKTSCTAIVVVPITKTRHPRQPLRRANPPIFPRYYVRNSPLSSLSKNIRYLRKPSQTKHVKNVEGPRSDSPLSSCAVLMKEVLYFTTASVATDGIRTIDTLREVI